MYITLTLTQCYLFIEFYIFILFLILAYHIGEINFPDLSFCQNCTSYMYIGQPGHDKHNIKSGINLLVSAVISISHSHNEIVFVHFPLISLLICSISLFILNGMDPAMAYSTSKWPCVLDTANVAVR